MLKLSSKKKNACLALAVAASILGGGTVFAAETANYTNTITGAGYIDGAYEDIIDENGVYKFTQDTQITHNQYGVELMENANIDATGKTLTFNIKDATLSGAGIKIDDANTLSIKANTVKMNLTNKSGVTLHSDGLQGVRITNYDAKLTVDGNLDITADGTTNTIGIYNRGNVVVNGDVKLNIEGHEGGTGIYGANGLYATSSMKSSKGGTITINGNVDFQGNANGIVANSGGAVVNVKGGNITINKNQTLDYAAIYAMDGVVNMNVLKDEEGNVTGADSNNVTIKGNIGLHTGATNSADIYGTKSELNLGLTTDTSSLTGVVYNQYGSDGVTINNVTFTGAANLWLQNGATWTNEKWGKTDRNFQGSYVTNFVGGASDAKAGNIFQNDKKTLTIGNYSGNTNIFYAHTGNGEATNNYAAGDTVINSAAAGSVVSLITDNTGVAMGNADNVVNVLNALAGKLTYSNFTKDEENLKGYVKIASGLTAGSAAIQTGDIAFNKADGKGTYAKSEENPIVPSKTEFTTTLTGDKDKDTEYAGNINGDGAYTFSNDSTITLASPENNAGAITAERDLTIEAAKDLKLKVNGSNENSYGLVQDAGKNVVINAENLHVDITNNKGRADAIHVNGSSNGERGSLTLNGNLNMKATHDISADVGGAYTLGAYTYQADIVINGNVTSAIDAGDGVNAYYGASHLYASGATGEQKEGYKAGTLTVNGNVDLSGTAQGLFANIGGAVVTVNGGGKIILDANAAKSNGYAAIRAENSTANMNVKLDAAGNATGGLGNDVVIKGNVTSSVGAVNSIDKNGTMTRVNLALDTEKSSLQGAIVNGFDREDGTTGIDTEADEGGSVSKHFTGENNLWLQNGATWTNELYGRLKFFNDDKYKVPFQGSHVTNFVGGASDAKAGNIFQNDRRTLTIDNYSGNTNIYYAHTGNGEAADNYAAGDTIIKHAQKDAAVTLITDNTGVSMDSEDSVTKVLNALAGKLTYSNFTTDENNLHGYVKIADGLTASSAAIKTGDITFNKEDGKGTYVKPEAPVIPPKTEFTTTLTGDTEADTEYAGNIQDGKYVFAADTTVKANANSAVDAKAPLTIEAGSNKLVLTAKKGSFSEVVAAFNHDVAGTTKITAGELVIGVPVEAYDHSGLVVKNGNVDITAATTTVHAHSDATNPAYGILAQNNGSRVDIHGDLKLANDSFGPTHGLWAEDAKEWGGKASIINVDGKVDINLKNGNALTAIRTGSTVTVGGGNIQIAKDNKNENYALKADGGNVNVNMKANKLSAGTTTTVIKGNAIAYSEKANSNFDYPDRDSVINIGLSDKDSSWTGVAFAKDLGTTGNPYKGIINLYVSNGATWNNEAWGKTNDAFAGSHVAKFIGGNSEAAAGNIFQKDSSNLTIDIYRGNTNIFYAHEGNGEAAGNYAAGDTIITSAVDGSVVNLITDNTGIAMDNEESVANVLNALAGKLTYSNYTEGERNLTGYAKIADGLTASSQTLKSEAIKFNKDTGKGATKDDAVNPGPGEDDNKNIFTDFISGEKQAAYKGVQQDNRSYVFTEDTTIKINQMTFKDKDPNWGTSFIISGAAVQNAAGVKDLVIKAEDKTLKLKVALDSQTIPPDPNAGILNNRIPLRGIDNSIAGSTTTITAGTLDIDIDNTYSRKTSSDNPMIGAGSIAAIYANSATEKAAVTVNGNTVIKAHGYNNVYGVNANGNAEIKLNGDLTMAKDGDNWAIENVIDGNNTTTLNEASWRSIAGINANGAGANVTVGGKTTIAAHGSGVVAADGATVKLGAADIEVKNNSDETGYHFHAIGAALGTVNVGDEGKTVTLKGNAGIFGKQGQDKTFASDSKESVINLKLTTEDSAWTGVAYKYFTDAEKEAGLSGSMNLTLANGASWNNEKYGYVYGDSEWEKYKFTGSEIANFVGGASNAKAGNIFQKDANSLTIDNYSGNTNIYYAHTGNGEAAENYAAGDTIIKHAAEGSVVSMITDNTGIAMDNKDSVNNVLNALAGKLTYSSFVTGEKNLTGFVKIADGLTASSKAMQTGNIAFSTEDGKGSLKKEDVQPPTPTYPEDQKADKFNQGITGNDEKYKEEGVLKEDGSYVFTKNPTSIEVEKGAAVEATDKDINIDTTKAKLELKGETGIKADGANVAVKGSTEISGNVGIDAVNGNVTLNGSTVINGTDAAINAGEGANVDINTNNSALNIKGDINANGGNITVDSGKATGTIESNVTASNGGNVEISLNDKNSTLTGAYNVDADSSIVMNIANGSTWNLTDDEDEASGMSLMRMAKAPAATAKGLTLNGGKTEAETGFINLQKRTKDVKIANYSGWETFIYSHEGAGDKVSDYKSGDTIIDKAAKGSGVIMSTDNSGINMKDKDAVEATLKALAQKVTYKDHEANGSNLTGKVQIADGLTSSSKSQNIGTLHWDENGKGQYDLDSVNWNQITEGDYETFVMKGVRSAATTSLHTWRDNMQDTYTGADMADEDGMFAKALGGKTSSEVGGLKDSNTYYGVQVGYDKAAANGWHTGVAFDYRNGDSNYLLGGKGDNQMYSLGVYGVKNYENNAYFRVAAKVGRVQNEYDVYNEIRSLKLHGDYKSNAYGLTMEYGKTFGDEDTYFTPKAQLTWSQVGSKDYTAHTENATMQVAQDSYSSFVGRLGFEAGVKSEKGRLYAGLFAAHEFNGDISASYFANDGDRKHTSFNGEETWMEMKLGGSYDFSKTAHLYADIAKDFGANFERKWKLNAGLRFEF